LALLACETAPPALAELPVDPETAAALEPVAAFEPVAPVAPVTPVAPVALLWLDAASAADNCAWRDWISAFRLSISVVLEELEDDALLPPPPPAPLLEDAADVVEPDEDEEDEEDVPEDVLPDEAFVVDAVLLLSEPDVVVFAAVDVVAPLVPSPAAASVEVVDCICMVLKSSSNRLIS
jgi:hypothetical protein